MAFLTKQEKYVILFLILGAIFGLSYSYYKKFHPPIDIRFRHAREKDPIPSEDLSHLLKEAKTVNINKAQTAELMKLKGIGPVLAHRIMEYRKAHGFFKDRDDLKEVPGIGPKKFDAIKDYISIE